MTDSLITKRFSLDLHWPTLDPFLFCAHHRDTYPRANGQMGPDADLEGRPLGQDFSPRDGWRMYHGETVPGFPAHPHRGFETVTVVREGFVDHADSLGAAGRYGAGDVQWMTGGRGLQHSEMFPLLSTQHDNPLELFQIWLNLPAANKLVEPHFGMFWQEQLPVLEQGGVSTAIIAGALGDYRALPPPPDSLASDPDHDVAIWHSRAEAGAKWSYPAADAHCNRMLYCYTGGPLVLNGEQLEPSTGVFIRADQPLTLQNAGDSVLGVLLLQGRPLNEPVAQYGPFVMNTRAQLQQAFADYQQTAFGGWPWPRQDQVHEATVGRFARHADGREEQP